jgi:hypothetical protein
MTSSTFQQNDIQKNGTEQNDFCTFQQNGIKTGIFRRMAFIRMAFSTMSFRRMTFTSATLAKMTLVSSICLTLLLLDWVTKWYLAKWLFKKDDTQLNSIKPSYKSIESAILHSNFFLFPKRHCRMPFCWMPFCLMSLCRMSFCRMSWRQQ